MKNSSKRDAPQRQCLLQVGWMDNPKPFSLPGDSGALYYVKVGEEIVPIGIHRDGNGMQRLSYGTQIENIIEILKAKRK